MSSRTALTLSLNPCLDLLRSLFRRDFSPSLPLFLQEIDSGMVHINGAVRQSLRA